MIRVLLINQDKIPHYRIPIYGYLSGYLQSYGFELVVVSTGLQSGSTHIVKFHHEEIPLSLPSLLQFIFIRKIDVVIFWVNLRHLYLLPLCMITKLVLRKKNIYWGHGRDLLDRDARLKNWGYAIQQALSDAVILYAEHLKKYIPKKFHKKTFVANNTLYITYQGFPPGDAKESVLAEYGVKTRKNIICMGRMQKRKRLDVLIEALKCMNRPDVGLILVGPDPEGVLNSIISDNIYKLGPIYGDKKFDLLSSADVYCLPGAVGLSIVDAFYCGLPLVTMSGEESPEIMYLKDGINGFIVPRGDVKEMSQKLLLLLDDDQLRERFSLAASREIRENGSMDQFCAGFKDALFYVAGKSDLND